MLRTATDHLKNTAHVPGKRPILLALQKIRTLASANSYTLSFWISSSTPHHQDHRFSRKSEQPEGKPEDKVGSSNNLNWWSHLFSPAKDRNEGQKHCRKVAIVEVTSCAHLFKLYFCRILWSDIILLKEFNVFYLQKQDSFFLQHLLLFQTCRHKHGQVSKESQHSFCTACKQNDIKKCLQCKCL